MAKRVTINDLKARVMHAGRASDRQIAEVLGVQKSAVCRWRKRNNLAANFASDGTGVINRHSKRGAAA